MPKFDINITEIEKKKFSGLESSSLVLGFKGGDVNRILLNTFRRASLSDIPTYAFDESTVVITNNTSRAFNNDYMGVRLASLPIFNVKNDFSYLDTKYWKNVDYTDNKRERHPKDTENIEMYVNAENKTNSIMNVTTKNAEFFNNGESMGDIYKDIQPILLIKLNPGDEFKCKCRAVLGLGERNDVWASASNAYIASDDEKDFRFTILSQGQLDEYDIMVKICESIKTRLKIIKNHIKYDPSLSKNTGNQSMKIIIDDEDYTIGNILAYQLQNASDIIGAARAKDDYLIKQIVIKYSTTNKDPIKPFFDAIDQQVELFDFIQEKLTKLGKKYL